MQFSFSVLLSGLFLAYMGHSIYSLVQIFIPPSCSEKHCLKSYLETKPRLELIICTSTKGSINRIDELKFVDQWSPLEYEKDFISRNVTIPLPWSTRRNGTLFLFAFVTPESKSLKDTWDQKVRYSHTSYTVFKLTQYLVPEAKTFNLLHDGHTNESEEKQKKATFGKDKPIAHITKRLRLSMLTDLLVLPAKELPQDFAPLLRLISSDTYLPPVRFDKFNSRLKDFYPVNSSEDMYTMEFEFSPMSIGLIRMGYQFEQAMDMMQGIGFSVKDMDEVKGIFTETNVYLLTLTMLVASVHLLFDFLAFKNDIVYWQNRRTTVGLSSKTILWRCFSQIVVFLYLLEEKSSLLVIIPGGIGAVIEIWKVTKAYKVSFVLERGMPRVRFGQLSASEKKTADHDVESMKYLSYILYPLILAGAVYSLLYTPHRSWYSWTIQSLVNGVYAFGFLFMLPQLFVNYRLKSVAHLPWRAFMYKAFNTFIDDLFAFIITMPTAHRMACFRDDIVFLIYLYQRWLYPVDKSRLDAGGEYELEVEASQTGEKEVKSGRTNGSNTKNKSQQKNKRRSSPEKSTSDKKGD